MKAYQRKQLRKELREVGAENNEINILLPVVMNLEKLKTTPVIDFHYSRRFLSLKKLGFSISLLAISILLIMSSQSVLPTSWLYPLQKISDTVAVYVKPSYRASVMMKRAQEVNELVTTHASQNIVLATLTDYKTEANSYKSMPNIRYAAFEYCKSRLTQAELSATPSEQQAIKQSLQSLDT